MMQNTVFPSAAAFAPTVDLKGFARRQGSDDA
jgi:hypothetical protein